MSSLPAVEWRLQDGRVVHDPAFVDIDASVEEATIRHGDGQSTVKFDQLPAEIRKQYCSRPALELPSVLPLLDGQVLLNAKVRKLMPEGLSIVHESGSATIAYSDLGSKLRSRFRAIPFAELAAPGRAGREIAAVEPPDTPERSGSNFFLRFTPKLRQLVEAKQAEAGGAERLREKQRDQLKSATPYMLGALTGGVVINLLIAGFLGGLILFVFCKLCRIENARYMGAANIAAVAAALGLALGFLDLFVPLPYPDLLSTLLVIVVAAFLVQRKFDESLGRSFAAVLLATIVPTVLVLALLEFAVGKMG